MRREGDFEKTIYEEFYYLGDFKNVLEDDETLVLGSSSVIAHDKDGNVVTDDVVESGTLSVSGSQLLAKVKAGLTSLSPYTVYFKCTTSNNNKYEAWGYMHII